MEHTYTCALCGKRGQEYYVFGDPYPETNMCPGCKDRLEMVNVCWEKVKVDFKDIVPSETQKEEMCWDVKVFDEETRTTTTLSKYGYLPDIIKELETDGLWMFVSASPQIEE